MKTDVAGFHTESAELSRHVDVLHQELIEQIRVVRQNDSLRQEMRTGFAMILQRLDDHEKRITSLEDASS